MLPSLWYFLKAGNSYKAGTYMGSNLSIGRPDKAYGGILIRAMMPVKIVPNSKGELVAKSNESKEAFVEGPCMCVRKHMRISTVLHTSENYASPGKPPIH